MANTSVLLVQNHHRHQGSAAELNRVVQSHRKRGDPETALAAPMGTCTISIGCSRGIKNP